MDLICNELSYCPISDNDMVAEKRFVTLLKTFKEAKKAFGFNRIRFSSNYSEQLITPDKTFSQWVSTVGNSNLKNTILSLYNRPFTDDLDGEELDAFFVSDYKITDKDVPTKTSPVGLPVAHIRSTITLSFDSHVFWRNRKINILKTNTSTIENLEFTAYNICLETDLKETEILGWKDNVISNAIDSKETLIKYLDYSKYGIVLTDGFIKGLLEWKNHDMKLFRRILSLMKDVELHPFVGGMGQTENLKHKGKEASKRINQADRLSYALENNTVTFVACKGHYNFHP